MARPATVPTLTFLALLAACASAAAVEPVLPEGFSATVFHPGVGAYARHLVVRDNGDVHVARRDGTLVSLRDADGDGHAERLEERALPITTGIGIHDGYLYFSDNDSVSRVALGEALSPGGAVETVIEGFPEQRSHADKAFAFDGAHHVYVNVGAPSNACQEKDRTPGAPGQRPCPLLERHAGIWRFDADRLGQTQADGTRYVTGTRNVVALDWNHAANALFFVMHGRDQLDTVWPERFDAKDNATRPAEEFHRAVPGADIGWPYTYYDVIEGRRLLNPEYGGDGERPPEKGPYREPIHAFPAHWAPNDLIFYRGDAFPQPYRSGAFIAFHGSWNRAPLPQAGYRITFVPFEDGRMSADPEDFMTGFAGVEVIEQPGDARYRPSGLAVGPDGALYVGETRAGRIWKVTADG